MVALLVEGRVCGTGRVAFEGRAEQKPSKKDSASTDPATAMARALCRLPIRRADQATTFNVAMSSCHRTRTRTEAEEKDDDIVGGQEGYS